jgi:hypothetical protein
MHGKVKENYTLEFSSTARFYASKIELMLCVKL